MLRRVLEEFHNVSVIGAGTAGYVYQANHIPSKIIMVVVAFNVCNEKLN